MPRKTPSALAGSNEVAVLIGAGDTADAYHTNVTVTERNPDDKERILSALRTAGLPERTPVDGMSAYDPERT
jgi:hypothetical protein